MTAGQSMPDARADWEARIGRRTATADRLPQLTELPPPAEVRAHAGRGQVTLTWEPVPGAVGYVVKRAASADGRYDTIDHLGGDVLAVPHPPYTDTTGTPTLAYHYRVAALADLNVVGPLSEPVTAASTLDGDVSIRARVNAGGPVGERPRPWRPMIGSEHLSHLLSTDTTGGRPIGAELALALRGVQTELGVQTVRAHAILGDDLGVYREVDGRPVHDFRGINKVYDKVLELGLRPVVELSFMPRDLARDPSKTVFEYRAIVSPPKDWERWEDLIRDLVGHLIGRYGAAEVRRWQFEVWNEANLEVFWSGTPAEYLQLYDVTARAVKSVDPQLKVGGPASAAAGGIGELLAYVARTGAPLDFVATHTYGSPPLDFAPLCARYGREDLDILWTEWGPTPTHNHQVGDTVFAATFLLRGMRSAAGPANPGLTGDSRPGRPRIDALAHWVASDHFEELGRPKALFHGGFGLLTVGNLRKPRYWALLLADRLGTADLPVALDGDGAGGLVEAWAGRRSDGSIGVLIWNGTLDQSKLDGEPALSRSVHLEVADLADGPYRLRHWRIDADHSNVRAVWQSIGGHAPWPSDAQWQQLRARNTLDEYEPEQKLAVAGGSVSVEFELPMPAVSYLEFTPA